MSALRTEPMFLYPQSRQFPFDALCAQIVHELEERNWDVPGITAQFDTYGTGEAKYRLVRTIEGDGFRLRFGRVQGRLETTWNDTAAVEAIVIPGKELRVYDEESGPTLYIYVGDNWEQDKDRFINEVKVNSLLRKQPRLYLKYKGGCDCQSTADATFDAALFTTAHLSGDTGKLAALTHSHPGRRAPLLVHDKDIGREYEPEGDEPSVYRTDEVFAEFTQWVEANVLAPITAQPPAEEKINVFEEENVNPTPFPEHAGPIFCFGTYRDAERVRQGRLNPRELEPGRRYAFLGSGYRLLTERNDGTVPEIAHEGFLWCGLEQVTGETAIDTLAVPGHSRADDERFLFRIIPKWADGIYVADHTPYEVLRQELLEKAIKEDRKRLTDEEVAAFVCARARTITPISEYDGSFEQPIVLINRELGFDEVELVSGPWPQYLYVKTIAERDDETREFFDQAMSAQAAACQVDYPPNESLEEVYDKVLTRLTNHLKDDEQFIAAARQYSQARLRRVDPNDMFMKELVATGREMQAFGLL